MIVMINGSFGVGKSTVAGALCERLRSAVLFDPEPLGIVVRQMTDGIRFEEEETDDFQDIALWRSLTLATAEQLYHRYERSLVVPMTLSDPTYFNEIRAGFERIGPPVYHFCLTAPLATIHRRLRERGDAAGSWPWRKAIQCVPALEKPLFREHIGTEGRDIEEVVTAILRSLPA